MSGGAKKILIYIAGTFIPTWLCWGILSRFIPDLTGNQIAQGVVAVSMWFPALGLFLTKVLSKEPLPVKPLFKPAVKTNKKLYLAAWFTPAVLTLLGGFLYFLAFPGRFGMDSDFFGQLRLAAEAAGKAPKNLLTGVIIAQAAAGLFLGPFFNMLFALGEELGWRGFLYPALREKLSPSWAVLVSGVIWGLWHAPITAMGHNYGFAYPGYPWTGILTMCVFCTFLGAFLAFITEKSGSIWPAALCHGALNAISGFPLLFAIDIDGLNRLWGPAITGLLAGLPLMVLGIWCTRRLTKRTGH